MSRTKFSINDSTGEISLKTKLDYEQQDTYEIEVTASDKGTPAKMNSMTFIINVTDVNDEPPKFDTNVSYEYLDN